MVLKQLLGDAEVTHRGGHAVDEHKGVLAHCHEEWERSHFHGYRLFAVNPQRTNGNS